MPDEDDTADEQRCFPDPWGMSDEEKIELIDALHESNHELIDQHNTLVEMVSGLAWGMHVLSGQAEAGNKWGKRFRTLTLLTVKLEVLAQAGLSGIGITSADVKQAEEFSAIVSSLEDDPTLQWTGDGDDQP